MFTTAGLIPAAGTSIQRAMGIDDTAQLFAADVQNKNSGEADPEMVRAICEGAAVTIEWLAGRYGFPFEVIDNFKCGRLRSCDPVRINGIHDRKITGLAQFANESQRVIEIAVNRDDFRSISKSLKQFPGRDFSRRQNHNA